MKAKEFIPASKPRNFVAKNQKTAGAGAHKDKKKAEKQGDVKHKNKQFEQGVAEGSLEEYGDTARGQKMLTKVQKRAVDRVVSKRADTDPAYAKKNKATADRAWDRMSGVEEASGSNTATLDAVFNEPDFDRLEHIWPALEAGDKKEALRQINHYLNKGKNRAWWGDLQALDIEIDQNDVENSIVMWSKSVQHDMEEAGKYGSGGYALDSDDAVYGHTGRYNRRERDWDEGNKEPPNNMAVYINGKLWKVFQGNGYYADDQREMNQYYKLQDWARKKSEQTGKKWEVSRTGAPATA